MNNNIHNYELLVQLDMALNALTPKYPFRLNQEAKYTQHQVELYKKNYCHVENAPSSKEEVQEQPSLTSGAPINIAVVSME